MLPKVCFETGSLTWHFNLINSGIRLNRRPLGTYEQALWGWWRVNFSPIWGELLYFFNSYPFWNEKMALILTK